MTQTEHLTDSAQADKHNKNLLFNEIRIDGTIEEDRGKNLFHGYVDMQRALKDDYHTS